MQGNSLVLNNIKYNVKDAKISFTDIGGNFKMFIDISASRNQGTPKIVCEDIRK